MRALTLSLCACAFSLFASPVLPTAQAVGTVYPPVPLVSYPVSGEYYNQPGIEPSLGGSIIYDELVPITCTAKGTPSFSAGTLQVRMVRTSSSSIDYYFRVVSVAAGRNISAVRVNTVNLSAVDADFRSDGLGALAPAHVLRDQLGTITFAYDGGTTLSGVLDSKFLFIRDPRVITPGTGWTSGGFTVSVTETTSGALCQWLSVGPQPPLP